MTDTRTPDQRRRIMSAVRRSGTAPELKLRKALWAAGVRGWRCDFAKAHGRPDLAWPKRRVAVFVDGAFWHGHPSRHKPGRSGRYWDEKIASNIERDRRVDQELEEAGWAVARFWDFEIEKDLERVVARVTELLGPISNSTLPRKRQDEPTEEGQLSELETRYRRLMARSRSDIANTAVRIFLQEMGREYDRDRGLEPFTKKHLRGEVLEFFDSRCCFCGEQLTAARVHGDHLIPTNKKDLGLDAWGNIVPACNPCNSEKHGKDWRDFIIQRAGTDAAERHQRMQEFLDAYPYKPTYELGSVVADLYDEVGAVAVALIHEKVARTKDALQSTP